MPQTIILQLSPRSLLAASVASSTTPSLYFLIIQQDRYLRLDRLYLAEQKEPHFTLVLILMDSLLRVELFLSLPESLVPVIDLLEAPESPATISVKTSVPEMMLSTLMFLYPSLVVFVLSLILYSNFGTNLYVIGENNTGKNLYQYSLEEGTWNIYHNSSI